MIRILPVTGPGSSQAAGAFFVGFLLPLIYVPRLTGAVVLTGWSLLTVALPFMVGKVEMRLPHWLGLAFLAYAAWSLTWSPAGPEELWHLGVAAGCFCLGSSIDKVSVKRIYIGLALGVTVNSAIVIAQVYGWNGIPQLHPPAGLMVNKLALGWLAALVLVALVSERLWWLIPGVGPSFLLTEARSAVLAVGVAAVAWLWPRFRTGALLIALGLALTAAAVVKIGYRASSLAERGAIALDAIDALTPAGYGLGSFVYYFPRIDTRLDAASSRTEHAHSDPVEYAFELGVGALPLFAMCLLLLAGGQHETERLVFIAFLVIAVTGFPMFVPATVFMGALAAGRLARDWALVRGPGHDRGPDLHPSRRARQLGPFFGGRTTIP